MPRRFFCPIGLEADCFSGSTQFDNLVFYPMPFSRIVESLGNQLGEFRNGFLSDPASRSI